MVSAGTVDYRTMEVNIESARRNYVKMVCSRRPEGCKFGISCYQDESPERCDLCGAELTIIEGTSIG